MNTDEEKQLFYQLFHQVYQVAIYLGVPEWVEVKYEKHNPDPIWGHLRHVRDGLTHLAHSSLFSTASHSARIALDSIVLADALGFGLGSDYEYQGKLLVASALVHDLGKIVPAVRKVVDKQGFTIEDMETMKAHVNLPAVREDITVIIADHHRWQSEAYTSVSSTTNFFRRITGQSYLKRTPESEILSKFLAILDFHDAAATRKNTKHNSTATLPSRQDLRGLMLQEYSDLNLRYKGGILPTFDMKGVDLIKRLFALGVLGRSDPFNPYSEPYSFIVRPNPSEQKTLRELVGVREKTVTGKIEMYGNAERRQISR